MVNPTLSFHHVSRFIVRQRSQLLTTKMGKSESSQDEDRHSSRQSRRENLRELSRLVLATGLGISIFGFEKQSLAYEQNYPQELEMYATDSSKDLQSIKKARIEAKRLEYQKDMDSTSAWNPLEFRDPKDFFTSVAWGGALWLLSGSRSNPLATPLANIIYDDKDEAWLKDRNEGLFAPLPLSYLLALGVVFFFLGVATERVILFLADGNTGVSLQLAGVSLIGGGAVELGRISTGEKKQTREDSDRDSRLAEEFLEFAQQRLLTGGNCHRSDVIRAFRRYYAKYRQADHPEFPLSDLEIERLLRAWTRTLGTVKISSAGFYKGVQINEDADVFAKR
jgi:hypothetical protein